MSEVWNKDESIYYEQSGDAQSRETLVFVHGATMTGAGMMPFSVNFPEYNCITVDLPGHGRSRGKTKTTVAEFADSMVYLIEELQKTNVATEQVTMLGFSMGGCITVEIALRKPTWLKRAVVLSSGADLKGNIPLIDKYCSMEDSEFSSEEMYLHLGGRYTSEEDLKAELIELLKVRCEDVTGLTDLRTAGSFNRQSEVGAIKIPLLVVAGDDDEIVPVHIPIRLRDAVCGSEMMILPYRGHSAIFEETDTAVRTIKKFMEFHPL